MGVLSCALNGNRYIQATGNRWSSLLAYLPTHSYSSDKSTNTSWASQKRINVLKPYHGTCKYEVCRQPLQTRTSKLEALTLAQQSMSDSKQSENPTRFRRHVWENYKLPFSLTFFFGLKSVDDRAVPDQGELLCRNSSNTRRRSISAVLSICHPSRDLTKNGAYTNPVPNGDENKWHYY